MAHEEDAMDPEEKWIIARAIYSEECALFQSIRRSIPRDPKRRNAAQIVQLEIAKQQLSKAAKKLRDEELEYRLSGATVPTALRPVFNTVKEKEKAKFGSKDDPKFQEMARIMLEGIEKGRAKSAKG